MTKLLSEIVRNPDKIIGLLKFSKREYLESLLEGNLYLNNFQHFKDQELKEKRKGQGDAYDLTLKMSSVHIEIRDNATGMTVASGTGNALMESKEDYQKHVYCTTAITADMLEVLDIKDGRCSTKLIIPDELKIKAEETFGDSVMLLDVNDFVSKIRRYCDVNKIMLVHNIVDYKDMSKNHLSRFKAFNEEMPSFYFEKDILFAYQHEYRFVFPNIISEEPETLHLDKLKDSNIIVSIKQFLNSDIRFGINLEN
ncbi:hypothetical protein OYT88_11835 [Sporolactobacillus sp. CQH2019]|uniref:hypothetical protein n=1 Tax=Sporolactobacillus sp. CQH2019 TaxID=3023512 RepID=UPI002368C990|nr:hypothetical protein [Sporolactobacillus sp. CQH2019]MDD9149244.1 hypothetical protein [Sporolactobacillus sp. CQH2019]